MNKWFIFVLIVILFSKLNGQITRSINFSISDLQISKITAEDGIQYSKPEIINLSSIEEPGLPSIPVKYLRLIVPSSSEVGNITVHVNKKETISLEYKIFPGQPGISTTINYVKPDFIKPDNKVYNSGEPYPGSLVKLMHSGYFDGVNHIVTVAVYPIQYFPKENKIDFISDLSFELVMSGESKYVKKVKYRSIEKQKKFDAILQNLVDNPEDIPKYKGIHSGNDGLSKILTTPTGDWDYVIVTTYDLAPAFNKFVEWKTRKGIRTYIKIIDEITTEYPNGDVTSGIDDDPGSVREFLLDTWVNNDITYALLAGHRDEIPFRYGCGSNNTWDRNVGDDIHHIPTDLYFGDFSADWDVDGNDPDGQRRYGELTGDTPDYNPEIFVGRLLFQSQQEVLDWTEKVIEYENNPFTGNFNNLNRFLWSQSDELQEGTEPDDAINSSTLFGGFTHFIISELPSYNSTEPTAPTGAQIITELNNGYHFYNIYNHGEEYDALVRCQGNHAVVSGRTGYQWGVFLTDVFPEYSDEPETGNGLDNINPENRSTIIYSIGCKNASYDLLGPFYRCMADVFPTLGNTGGTAFLGNTRVGWVGSSNVLHQSFISRLYDDSPNLYNLGEAEAISKFLNPGTDYHYLAYSHNLFGDPEMPVWTNTPSQFANVNITVNASSVTVNAGVAGSNITVCSIDGGVTYYLSVPNRTSYTFNTAIRPLYITITNENFITYCAITGGTVNHNISWHNTLDILGNITISSGYTLTVDPGSVLYFRNNSNLSVSGTLYSNGSTDRITFDFIMPGTSSNQNGIFINSSGSSTITHCNILNAYKGISLTSSTSNTINNNEVYNNTVGIYCLNLGSTSMKIADNDVHDNYDGIFLNYSSPYLHDNLIHDNDRNGIKCYNNCAPKLYNNISNAPFNNAIYNNVDGLYCDYLAAAKLGEYGPGYNVIRNNTGRGIYANNSNVHTGHSPDGGLNSIYSNSSYELEADNNSIVFAENNWWGSPVGGFRAINGSSIDNNPMVDPYSDPNGGLPKSSSSGSEIAGNDESVFDNELKTAIDYQSKEKYDEAMVIYKRIIHNNISSKKSYYSLAALSECYQSAKNNQFLEYLTNSVKSRITSENPLKKLVKELEVHWQIIDGKYDEAVSSLNSILIEFAANDDAVKHALFNKGYIYFSYFYDAAKAESEFSILEKLYPDDDLVIDSKIMLGKEIPAKIKIDIGKEESSETVNRV